MSMAVGAGLRPLGGIGWKCGQGGSGGMDLGFRFWGSWVIYAIQVCNKAI